jgi:hypothetical protein
VASTLLLVRRCIGQKNKRGYCILAPIFKVNYDFVLIFQILPSVFQNESKTYPCYVRRGDSVTSPAQRQQYPRSKNRVCLSRGVQEAGAIWRAATRTVAGVGDLVQRTGDGSTGRVLGDRAIESSGGAVCGLHLTRGD